MVGLGGLEPPTSPLSGAFMVLCIVMHSIFFMRGCSGTKFFGFGIQPSWRSSLLGDPEANFLRKTGPRIQQMKNSLRFVTACQSRFMALKCSVNHLPDGP